MPVTRTAGALLWLPGMRAVVSGCLILGRLPNVFARGPVTGDTMTVNALPVVDEAMPLIVSARRNCSTAHSTGSLVVTAEPGSTISAIALPVGKACVNSIAVTEAAAVVSFRKA